MEISIFKTFKKFDFRIFFKFYSKSTKMDQILVSNSEFWLQIFKILAPKIDSTISKFWSKISIPKNIVPKYLRLGIYLIGPIPEISLILTILKAFLLAADYAILKLIGWFQNRLFNIWRDINKQWNE